MKKKLSLVHVLTLALTTLSCAAGPPPGDVEKFGVAVSSGDFETAREYLRSGVDPSGRLRDSATPLHVVSASPTWEGVEFLIQAGADVNAVDDEGMSPLLYAVKSGHPQSIVLLLGAGANPDRRANDGRTAESLASFRKDRKVLEALQTRGGVRETRAPG